MGCSPSRRNDRLVTAWGDSFHNSVVPISRYPPCVNDWTGSPMIESSYASPRLRDVVHSSEEPPPYTEVAEHGHISLMHSNNRQSYKAVEEVMAESMDFTANDPSLVETSHNGNYSTLSFDESNQDRVQCSPVRYDHMSHSLDVFESQALFQPNRTSSPLRGNRSSENIFPARPRSQSIDLQSLQSLHSGDTRILSPVRPSLPPLTQTGTNLSRVNSADRQVDSWVMPASLFPPRPHNRLPPLEHQVSQPATYHHVHVDRRTSGTSGNGHVNKRKKPKRRRMHSWHGERVAPQAVPAIGQNASNTPPVEE